MYQSKSSTATGDKEEGRDFPHEEIARNIKKTLESFFLVEDSLNGLFENIFKSKIQLHENWEKLQVTLKELIIQSENTSENLSKNETQDCKIEQCQNEVREQKEEIVSLKIQLRESTRIIKSLKQELEQYTEKKGKQENEKKSDKSEDLPTLVKAESNDSSDLNSGKKTKAASESEDRKIEQCQNEILEQKEEIDSLKTQLKESTRIIKSLKQKLEQYTEKKGKQENEKKSDKSEDLPTLVKAESNDSSDLNSGKKTKAASESEDQRIEQYQNEILELKEEIDSLKNQLSESGRVIKLLKQELEEHPNKNEMREKENKSDKSEDLPTLGKVENNDNNDLNAEKKTKAACESEDCKVGQLNEILELKVEVESLKIQLSDLYQRSFQYPEKKEKQENDNISDKSEDLASWVTVESNYCNDSNAGKKTNIGSESDVGQLEEEGEAKAKSKKRKEAGQKEDEKTTLTENQFQDAIKLLNDFYDNDWTEANISLLEGNRFDQKKIMDILFYVLWTSYRNIFLMVNKLLQKLSEVFDFHTWNFSAKTEPVLYAEIENTLIEVILKFKSQEKDMLFKEELMNYFSVESAKYLNENPEFTLYFYKSHNLIRQLFLKHKNCFLKSHKIGEKVDRECFEIAAGSEKSLVQKTIFPALFTCQNGKLVVLRKGIITTICEQ